MIHEIRGLSIQEPYATLIQKGKKTIETRTWKTSYSGNVLLCASKKPKSKISGHAFAVAKITKCIPMKKEHEKDACCEIYPRANSWFIKEIVLIKPFPFKGRLGLFKLNTEELFKLDEALENAKMLKKRNI